MHPVNVEIHDAFVLRTDANAAITGEVAGDFAVLTAFLVSAPATTAAVTLAEVGTGAYRIRFTPTTVGRWCVRIVYDTGGTFREWLGVYDVVTAAQFDPLSALTSGYASGTVGAAIARIGAGSAVVSSPVIDGGSVTVVKGDDYLLANGRALEWTSDDWPDLTAATVQFAATFRSGANSLTKAMTVVTAGAAVEQKVRMELSDAETSALTNGTHRFRIAATIGAGTVTLVEGAMVVTKA